jgi:uncharacterized protein
MSESPGSIGWHDLTVTDAPRIRDFYQEVVGWTAQPLDVGGYDDFLMFAPSVETPAAGICHARGVNAALPPVWLIYFVVADLDASVDACLRRGGEVIAAERRSPDGRYCVIRDPAGAVAALYERAAAP